ncbi:MAG: glycosyltransferase [Flavobacteriaceae bacterium TMED68]|nr:MAG: glycosyltransferase [Flavobacteriaceae bacterium TMED68]|tara:strand:+ start:524 stop:1213 length:690 start_codon:yes stop_codon:yes gene_type:complete
MKISILIPVYNEENTVIEILEKVNKQKNENISLEVIVIDDGSTDGSAELLSKKTELYNHFIKLEKNSGKGAAVKEGLKIATGDYILFQDADLEYDPSDYSKIFYVIKNFNAEVIIGSRNLSPEYVRVYNFFHKLGNKVITGIFNFLNNTTFTDIYSCYLCFKKESIDEDKIKSNGWEQQAEILSVAIQNSTIHYEVPISYSGRTFREGKKIKGRHVLKVIYMILKKRIF